MPRAWGPCQRHGDDDTGMETMPKAWGPCQKHGDHANGMETMPMAWGPCQWHGDHAKGNQPTMIINVTKPRNNGSKSICYFIVEDFSLVP